MGFVPHIRPRTAPALMLRYERQLLAKAELLASDLPQSQTCR